jgi:HD-GYP domain-containing protein (c-di-GMP phosphodiesterase class II)
MMRVNKMLKTEVELREEQEDILKKNFHRLESLVDETVGAITLIVERKDPHVADHQRRVCLLSCAIAQEMNSRNDRMRAVRMAAQLHDLGKIFIPAEIMRKPGKLTDAEMSVVKTHPDTDYQILKRINFPISIADVVRQHHERLDGSGYPQGLKGDAILIEARIIAVADVIEGMIFERPYRVAPGLEAALKEIADNKGTLYDPAVANACLKLFAEKRFQFEGMPVQPTAVAVGPVSDHRDL